MIRISRIRLLLTLGALAVGMVAASSQGQEKKDDNSPGEILNKATDKPVAQQMAARIDFNTAYGLSFDMLRCIGQRIDESRKMRDPVGLGAVATELAAMEKISGKTATLTSQAVASEAIELAKLRGNSHELKALATIIRDESLAKDLTADAKKAEALEASAKTGERSRGLGRLQVQNLTGYLVLVEVNGTVIGVAQPYFDTWFNIGHGLNINTAVQCGAIVNGQPYLWQKRIWYKDNTPVGTYTCNF